MYIPTALYEALPYLYILIGLASTLGLDPTAGRISGLLLLSAGVAIRRLRRKYRRDNLKDVDA